VPADAPDLDVKISLTAVIGLTAFFTLTWGTLIWMVMQNRTRQLAAPVAGAPPINIWNITGGVPEGLPAGAPMAQLAAPQLAGPPMHAREIRPSKMNTYSLGIDAGARVMTAGSDRSWQVQLRNIGPAGSIAYVADDANALMYPSMSLAIPAGGFVDVRVGPRGALFARGTVPGVQLSVTAGEIVE
jgi:hypothetical protein